MLTGESGVGLLTIARDMSGLSLSQLLQPKNKKGEIDLISGTITAESIRELYEHTRGKHASRRIVIVDTAERMSLAAQAAFLKLLEEPSSSTFFILTSHHLSKILPTIRSRVQIARILRITDQQSLTLIEQSGIRDSHKIAQLQFLAIGRPAELCRLLNDDDYFKVQATYVSDAHRFLKVSRYERLILASKYFKNRSDALQFIDCCSTLLRRTLSQNPQAKLVHQLEELIKLRTNVQANANIRLQLTRFVL